MFNLPQYHLLPVPERDLRERSSLSQGIPAIWHSLPHTLRDSAAICGTATDPVRGVGGTVLGTRVGAHLACLALLQGRQHCGASLIVAYLRPHLNAGRRRLPIHWLSDI